MPKMRNGSGIGGQVLAVRACFNLLLPFPFQGESHKWGNLLDVSFSASKFALTQSVLLRAVYNIRPFVRSYSTMG